MILGNHFIFFELKQYPISQPTLPELAGGVAHSYEVSCFITLKILQQLELPYNYL